MVKQSELDNRPITAEQFQILKRVTIDPFFFLNFIYVIHPIRGKVQFIPYGYQKAVLYEFLTKRFNIILKFRQAGITELMCAYILWLAQYHVNKNILVISIKETVAKRLLRRVKYMYKNLPPYLKVPIINGNPGAYGTAQEMEFSTGSIIQSIPTTEEAGRSEPASLLVIDEAAMVRWADKIWASAFPTLSTGGSAIINSTPLGVNNFYHSLWVDAHAGGNDFNPIRLKWQMHPERDMAWYELQRRMLGPRKTAQEIDGDFLQSGNTVFEMSDIRALEEEALQHKTLQSRYDGKLNIFKLPKEHAHYYIGADVASGRSRDYSAFSVMDRNGVEYAAFKGRIGLTSFADLLMEIGKLYNKAMLAPEGNDIGAAVVARIQQSGYSNLYYSKSLVKRKGKPAEEKDIPGWYTTLKNRSLIINELEEDVRFDKVQIFDEFFFHEAYTFIYDSQGRAVAQGKETSRGSDDINDNNVCHDDSIMAKCITNHIRKIKPKAPVILPV